MKYLTHIILDNEIFKIKKTTRNLTVFFINHKPDLEWEPIIRIVSNSKIKFISNNKKQLSLEL